MIVKLDIVAAFTESKERLDALSCCSGNVFGAATGLWPQARPIRHQFTSPFNSVCSARLHRKLLWSDQQVEAEKKNLSKTLACFHAVHREAVFF